VDEVRAVDRGQPHFVVVARFEGSHVGSEGADLCGEI
jgi:hypothetical protein